LRGQGYAAGAAALSPRSKGEPQVVSALKAEFGGLLGVDLSAVNVALGSTAGGGHGLAQRGEVHLSITEDALQEREGRWLFAHELIHHAQGKKSGNGEEADCEVEAEELASRLVEGSPAQVQVAADPATALYHKPKTGSWHLLSWPQKRSAIRYNRRRLSKSKIRKVQNTVGVKDDGVVGPITVAGIARWQSKHGLGADGKVGPKTWGEIHEHLAPQPGAPGTASPPNPHEGAPVKSGQLSAHFSLAEFRSKDGAHTPQSVMPNLKELAANLEVLRAAAGGKSISVSSGYRSPAHNKAVGGATHSQHKYGRAADIKIAGMSAWQTKQLIIKLINQGKMKQGGVGLYSTFVHYDTRGYAARW